ncbi:MAG: hypothetical protein ACYDA3_12765 [Gaiellaceae bacterium]
MFHRLAATGLVALATAAPAFAGDINVGFGIRTGTLGVQAAPTSLGGTVQVSVTVVDARGNGKGWQLRLAGHGAPTISSITVRCAAGSTCTLPQAQVSLPSAIGSTPTPVFSAAARSGLGAVVLVLTVSGGRGPLSATVVSR